mgnify:CR=1 FL=1
MRKIGLISVILSVLLSFAACGTGSRTGADTSVTSGGTTTVSGTTVPEGKQLSAIENTKKYTVTAADITPEDAARVVAWLASDEAAWITGQVINSEGGFLR